MADRQVLLSDVERAIQLRDPQLADLVISYLEQGDPDPGHPEVEETRSDEGEEREVPPDQWTLPRLRSALSPAKLAPLNGTERKAARREAWDSLMAAPNPPPRLFLGRMLIDLYEAGDEPARAALKRIFLEGKMRWGVWQAAKRIYKLCEERLDAELFGVLGYRLDMLAHTPLDSSEIGAGTVLYLRRRVWRFLRQLGQAVPALYPDFAVQVLKHYPARFSLSRSWVASQVFAHKSLIGSDGRSGVWSIPRDLEKVRAFSDAWKVSPSPLLRLLEDAQAGEICEFAIKSLQKDFPETLRRPEPAWLARLGKKRLSAVDAFIVEVLKASPELHQSKLKELGLHELVLGLLHSENDEARAYAIEYARAHAPEIAVADLLALIDEEDDVKEFALMRLSQKSAAELGLRALGKLLEVEEAAEWAAQRLRDHFRPDSFDAATFRAFYTDSDEQRDFVVKLFADAKVPLPTKYLQEIVVAEETSWDARDAAMDELETRSGRELGFDWVKKNIDHDEIGYKLQSWVRSGKFKADELDLEWLKSLVTRPRLRSFAVGVIKERELVPPAKLGLSWLLEMARRPEEEIQSFAQTALLEGFAPSDFAPGKSLDESLSRLYALAAGPEQPETVRAFAATYLKVHHPDLNGSMAEARQHAIEPKLGHEAYTLARVRPLLDDRRPDVRRLGVAVAKHELLRWGDATVLYQMADSPFPEVRTAGCELLLSIDPAASTDSAGALPVSFLDAARVFGLGESLHKVTRETALTVIRRHYDKLGSAERLGWLMDSPDRDVQLAAVRLLWERHRPRPTPADWRPKTVSVVAQAGEAFASTQALREFLRTVLFGLPPGRLERRDLPGGEGAPDRALPASLAKRRVVDTARDLACADREFAQVVVPVLEEFMASQAKMQWQGCVAALAAIRAAHPGIDVGLPPPATPPLHVKKHDEARPSERA